MLWVLQERVDRSVGCSSMAWVCRSLFEDGFVFFKSCTLEFPPRLSVQVHVVIVFCCFAVELTPCNVALRPISPGENLLRRGKTSVLCSDTFWFASLRYACCCKRTRKDLRLHKGPGVWNTWTRYPTLVYIAYLSRLNKKALPKMSALGPFHLCASLRAMYPPHASPRSVASSRVKTKIQHHTAEWRAEASISCLGVFRTDPPRPITTGSAPEFQPKDRGSNKNNPRTRKRFSQKNEREGTTKQCVQRNQPEERGGERNQSRQPETFFAKQREERQHDNAGMGGGGESSKSPRNTIHKSISNKSPCSKIKNCVTPQQHLYMYTVVSNTQNTTCNTLTCSLDSTFVLSGAAAPTSTRNCRRDARHNCTNPNSDKEHPPPPRPAFTIAQA